jgi:hypothetical protein
MEVAVSWDISKHEESILLLVIKRAYNKINSYRTLVQDINDLVKVKLAL